MAARKAQIMDIDQVRMLVRPQAAELIFLQLDQQPPDEAPDEQHEPGPRAAPNADDEPHDRREGRHEIPAAKQRHEASSVR